MDNLKFGFIGSGNMGGALAKAVTRAVGGSNVYVSDKANIKAQLLAQELRCNSCETDEIVKNCDFIFLGVKPQAMSDVLKEIAPALSNRGDRFVLVTMAAGLKMSFFDEVLGTAYPIIRIMPNTPVSVGKGMVVYTHNKNVFMDEIGEFTSALRFAGRLDKIDEKLIDAAAALSGCGPAFIYMFAESLSDAAVEGGLPRNKANEYAAQTLLGAAEMLLASGKHAGELKDAVCSPNGTTIAGVHALEEKGFRGTVMSAVKAALDKTKML